MRRGAWICGCCLQTDILMHFLETQSDNSKRGYQEMGSSLPHGAQWGSGLTGWAGVTEGRNKKSNENKWGRMSSKEVEQIVES